MPDFRTVLASIREDLAVVERRRADLEREREAVEADYVRLSAALSVLEERLQPAGPVSGTDAQADSPSVTDRVFDAIADSSARTRGELLRKFKPLGVKENSIDSALTRLKRRKLIVKQGRWFVPVDPPPSTAPGAASSETSSAG